MMDHNSPLTVEQQQRQAALETAKSLLSAYREPVDPADLVAVAEWIVEPEAERRQMAARLRKMFAPGVEPVREDRP